MLERRSDSRAECDYRESAYEWVLRPPANAPIQIVAIHPILHPFRALPLGMIGMIATLAMGALAGYGVSWFVGAQMLAKIESDANSIERITNDELDAIAIAAATPHLRKEALQRLMIALERPPRCGSLGRRRKIHFMSRNVAPRTEFILLILISPMIGTTPFARSTDCDLLASCASGSHRTQQQHRLATPSPEPRRVHP